MTGQNPSLFQQVEVISCLLPVSGLKRQSCVSSLAGVVVKCHCTTVRCTSEALYNDHSRWLFRSDHVSASSSNTVDG